MTDETTISKFLKYLISLLIDHPSELVIEEEILSENSYRYLIKTNPEDTGKVIGKEGKIIQSIRNVAKILAIKENKQIRIEIGEQPIVNS